jgi:small ubiquitin-related modifier
VARCQREYLWDEAKCRRVLNAYRQFLELKKTFEDWDATILSPSQVVDQMWHQHLLDVTNYCHDTILLCGHVVGHNPDGALDGPAKAARTKTTRDALFENFGSDYNKKMWLTPTELHEEERIDSKIPITLILRDQTGEQTSFKLKRSTELSGLFNTYAKMKGVVGHDLRFLFGGERIPESATPFDLELNDQDEIDVILEGSGC